MSFKIYSYSDLVNCYIINSGLTYLDILYFLSSHTSTYMVIHCTVRTLSAAYLKLKTVRHIEESDCRKVRTYECMYVQMVYLFSSSLLSLLFSTSILLFNSTLYCLSHLYALLLISTFSCLSHLYALLLILSLHSTSYLYILLLILSLHSTSYLYILLLILSLHSTVSTSFRHRESSWTSNGEELYDSRTVRAACERTGEK